MTPEELFDRLCKAFAWDDDKDDYAICSDTPLLACNRTLAESLLEAGVEVVGDRNDLAVVMPPTYKKEAKNNNCPYHFEDRYFNGEVVSIVVLDGVASTANREEIAAYKAWQETDDQGRRLLRIPMVETVAPALSKTLSVLDLSHRIFDFTLASSVLKEVLSNGRSIIKDGDKNKPFPETTFGQAIYSSVPQVAMLAFLQLNPVGAALGGWCSTVGNVRGLRLPRSSHGEIIARKYTETLKSASKIDPLGIQKQPIICKEIDSKSTEDDNGDAEEGGEKKKGGKKKEPKIDPLSYEPYAGGPVKKGYGKREPSDVVLGNIPPTLNKAGVSTGWIIDRFTLSLQGLLNLDIGDPKKNRKVRPYLAALALYIHVLKRGNYFLRSGCDLRPKEKGNTYRFEGFKPTTFTLTPASARKLYDIALDALGDIIDPTLHLKLEIEDRQNTLVARSN